MTAPLHAVAETAPYLDDCKAELVSEAKRAAIVDVLARTPKVGDVIRDSDGARKVRVGGRGHGKSGGYRVITAYVGEDAPVYLLALYSKGEKANLSAADLRTIRTLMTTLKKFWRKELGP
jgi:hypothetical protein